VSHRNGGQRDQKIRLAQRSWARASPDATDPKVIRGCTGKRGQYYDKHSAREAAAAATKKHGVKFDFYRCKVGCRLFHLTTTPKHKAPDATQEPVPIAEVVRAKPPEPLVRSLAGSAVKRMVRRA
jgi:hypothetical protein